LSAVVSDESVLPPVRELVAKARTAIVPVIYLQRDGCTRAPRWCVFPMHLPVYAAEPLADSRAVLL